MGWVAGAKPGCSEQCGSEKNGELVAPNGTDGLRVYGKKWRGGGEDGKKNWKEVMLIGGGGFL